MNIYLFLSSVIFLAIGITWAKTNFLNVTIKLMFILLASAGFFFFFHNMGFIVQQNIGGSMRLY